MAIRYRKFQPTDYVIKVRQGRVIEEGPGLSCLYNTMTTSLMVLPATAFDSGFAFDDMMTADFQKINVQGDISYIIADYGRASRMVNFSYGDRGGAYEMVLNEARLRMAKRIMSLTKVYTATYLSAKTVKEAVKSANELAGALRQALRADETIKDFGLEILAVSILGIMPQPDTRKALEAATREEILKQQDDAIYKRRNAAIEQERAIKENELNTEIRIAEKAREKKEREMETKRMLQEKQAQLDAGRIEKEIELEEERRRLVDLQTENERKKSDARAYDSQVLLHTLAGVDAEIVKALTVSGMDSRALIAKAFAEIGDKADKIGVLNVSPDLLETLSRA